jgi:hypothetical protein
LLAKPTPLNINLSSDRFAMFNNERDIFSTPAAFNLDIAAIKYSAANIT